MQIHSPHNMLYFTFHKHDIWFDHRMLYILQPILPIFLDISQASKYHGNTYCFHACIRLIFGLNIFEKNWSQVQLRYQSLQDSAINQSRNLSWNFECKICIFWAQNFIFLAQNLNFLSAEFWAVYLEQFLIAKLAFSECRISLSLSAEFWFFYHGICIFWVQNFHFRSVEFWRVCIVQYSTWSGKKCVHVYSVYIRENWLLDSWFII